MNASPNNEFDRHHRAGIALFQAGEYWEAHEAWEYCWHAASDPERAWYKGVIQAAAALEQWRRGNPRGLQRNWAKARAHLIGGPAHWRGIHLADLVVAMDRFVRDEARLVAPRLILEE